MNIKNPFTIGGEPTPPPRYTKEFDDAMQMWVLTENGKPFGYILYEAAAAAIVLALTFRRNALSILPTLFVSAGKLWSN